MNLIPWREIQPGIPAIDVLNCFIHLAAAVIPCTSLNASHFSMPKIRTTRKKAAKSGACH
jgi:hypothetical protein